MKSKVPAYTINEMLIVIIVSTIIIGIAFSVLTLVQRHIWAIQEHLKLNTELNRLEQSLWIDTAKYGTISFSEQDNTLVFSSPIDSAVYHFNEKVVTKSTDTFHVAFERKQFYFNGNITNTKKVDAFRLELPKVYGKQRLFIFKQTDATQFMN
ncbi:hypothetical protein [uncultured Psychroserpens sp.]|uniref:hypothetical protein n=1 Tax=uncultured Psychroserpens sp. TaxID=255436 RepID=UPI00261549E6|nr:hypothetical protein [uncultured Psychroserpens sp.]